MNSADHKNQNRLYSLCRTVTNLLEFQAEDGNFRVLMQLITHFTNAGLLDNAELDEVLVQVNIGPRRLIDLVGKPLLIGAVAKGLRFGFRIPQPNPGTSADAPPPLPSAPPPPPYSLLCAICSKSFLSKQQQRYHAKHGRRVFCSPQCRQVAYPRAAAQSCANQ